MAVRYRNVVLGDTVHFGKRRQKSLPVVLIVLSVLVEGDTRFCIKLLLIVSFRFLFIIQPACVNEINTSWEEEVVNHQRGDGSQCNKIL